MEYNWAQGNTQTARDAMQIRMQVFVAEQGFSAAAQHDGLDDISWHVVGYSPAGALQCTARITPQQGTVWHVGRVAVLAQWRGTGVGRQLLEQVFAKARSLGVTRLTLTAQQDKVGFYSAVGFVPVGQAYIHEDYPHIDVEYNL